MSKDRETVSVSCFGVIGNPVELLSVQKKLDAKAGVVKLRKKRQGLLLICLSLWKPKLTGDFVCNSLCLEAASESLDHMCQAKGCPLYWKLCPSHYNAAQQQQQVHSPEIQGFFWLFSSAYSGSAVQAQDSGILEHLNLGEWLPTDLKWTILLFQGTVSAMTSNLRGADPHPSCFTLSFKRFRSELQVIVQWCQYDYFVCTTTLTRLVIKGSPGGAPTGNRSDRFLWFVLCLFLISSLLCDGTFSFICHRMRYRDLNF